METNKKKRQSSIKFLWLFFSILAVGGWLSSTIYIGKQTEQQITATLKQEASSTSGFHLELVDYKRSFFQASFNMRLRATNKELDTTFSQLIFHTEVKHGPLVFNQHDLQFALVSFSTELDKSRLDGNMDELVKRLFTDKTPFTAKLLIDYKKNKHYQFHSSPLEYKVANIAFNLSRGSLNTIVKSRDTLDVIELKMSEIRFRNNKYSLTSHNNKIVLGLSPYKKSRLTSSMTITHKAKYTDLSINLDDLRLNTVFEWLASYENRFNIDQQIEWTLEDAAQYQEGQDRLIALFSQQADQQLPDTEKWMSQLFKQGANDITYLHKIDNTELAYNTLISHQ